MRKISLAVVLVLTSLLLQGCLVTMDKHKALSSRVEETEKNIDVLDANAKRNDERIENVKTYFEGQNSDLRDQLANIRADLDELKTQVASLNGGQESLQYKLDQIMGNVKGLEGRIEDKLAGDTGVLPQDLPQDPDALFAYAAEKYGSGQTKTAMTVFREFLRLYPEHDKADDSQFFVGECLFALAQFGDAITEYRKVYDQYQKGDKFREAVLRIGLCYERLNRCKKAEAIYKFAYEEFRKTPEGAKAKEKSAAIQKTCK